MCAIKNAKVKEKRGRKRNSNALEADELEADKQELEPELEADLEPEVACVIEEVINGRGKHGRKRKITTDEPKPEVALYTPVL
jgi:hypothetical protein